MWQTISSSFLSDSWLHFSDIVKDNHFRIFISFMWIVGWEIYFFLLTKMVKNLYGWSSPSLKWLKYLIFLFSKSTGDFLDGFYPDRSQKYIYERLGDLLWYKIKVKVKSIKIKRLGTTATIFLYFSAKKKKRRFKSLSLSSSFFLFFSLFLSALIIPSNATLNRVLPRKCT